jgi:hypothetical protein
VCTHIRTEWQLQRDEESRGEKGGEERRGEGREEVAGARTLKITNI